MTRFVEEAHAKLNLSLRVLRRRDDGFHDIESLVAFAGLADDVEFTRGNIGGNEILDVQGEFADKVPVGTENSILQACDKFSHRQGRLPQGRILLHKRIPPAAGLGGGSSDAAAMLRIFAGEKDLFGFTEMAARIGSDVPVCLHQRPALMRGRGERFDFLHDSLPPLWVVLAKPPGELSTRDVYGRWDEMFCGKEKEGREESAPLPSLQTQDVLLDWLRKHPNDLQAVAVGLLPEIENVIRVLEETAGCLLARMSGSGPACFALYEKQKTAEAARDFLDRRHSNWWLHAGDLCP